MKREERARNLYSFAVSSTLITPAYMLLFEALFGMDRSVSLMIMAGVILMCMAVALVMKIGIKMNKSILWIVGSFCLLYIASFRNLNHISYSIVQFGFYVLIPAYLMSQDIDFEKILRCEIILSLPIILKVGSLMEITNWGLFQADMYNIYAMVPFILASFSHFLHYRKKGSLWVKLGYLLNVYYAVRISINAVRGFLLVLICYIAFEILYWLKTRNKKKNYTVILVGISAVLSVVVLNFSSIITGSIRFLEQIVGGDWSFLAKMTLLLERGDFSNGRISIWANAIRCFSESPIWGHGIGGFQVWNNSDLYPHNFILQLLIDGGILIGAFPIYVAVKGVWSIIVSQLQNKDNFVFAIFLTAASFPSSLLSGDMWKSSILWMTLFFYCKYLLTKGGRDGKYQEKLFI